MKYVVVILLVAGAQSAPVIFNQPVPVLGEGTAFEDFLFESNGWDVRFAGRNDDIGVVVRSSGFAPGATGALGRQGSSFDGGQASVVYRGTGLPVVSGTDFRYGFAASGAPGGLLLLSDVPGGDPTARIALIGYFRAVLTNEVYGPNGNLLLRQYQIIISPTPEPSAAAGRGASEIGRSTLYAVEDALLRSPLQHVAKIAPRCTLQPADLFTCASGEDRNVNLACGG